ncbi:unannotated protein [freshwater metagenome]|uniref:Unannotated protein n=1 Tax=freshwater metagenome TaxID=449393 RepID=A0A6J7ENZ2_9ZZZZ
MSSDHREGPHNPPHVGDPLEVITGLDIKRVGSLTGDLHGEAAVDMNRSLRLTGCSRGVGEHPRVLCSRVVSGPPVVSIARIEELTPQHVAALVHLRGWKTSPLEDHNPLNRWAA